MKLILGFNESFLLNPTIKSYAFDFIFVLFFFIKALDADKSNDISGELKINLADMDLSKSNEIWGDIIKVKRQAIDRPELLISLNYLPQAARLTLVVIRTKNLEHDELFVRVSLNSLRN